jgi:hypothetical protein
MPFALKTTAQPDDNAHVAHCSTLHRQRKVHDYQKSHQIIVAKS